MKRIAGFNWISTRSELASFLNVELSKLNYILYVAHVDQYYIHFEIPKKNGGTRPIDAPTGALKTIQATLAKELWIYQREIWKEAGTESRISHGFEPGKSIISNAEIHRNKRFVLNLDLESFFDSFHFGRVRGFFEKNRYFHLPREVATVIAQLTCYQGHLPQGAPSSPIITNLISQILDQQLLKLARQYRLDYTRYADDLTFSTNDRKFLDHQEEFLSCARNIITRAGFRANEQKTRFQFKDSRQEVTGLVVNKKLSIKHEYCKKTRAMAYKLYSSGEFDIGGHKGTLNQLEGRFAFIDQLDQYACKLGKSGKRNFHNLNGREKLYQEFLFYRYFFSNQKPLIVTEGKTDIAYIQAALKNLQQRYPNLVPQGENGEISFQVHFLKRSKRLEELFGFSLDGANAMQNLYDFFVNEPKRKVRIKDKYIETRGYPAYFQKMSGATATHPVIFVFDNELKAQENKPLKAFTKRAHIGNEAKEQLEKDYFLPLPDAHNLFLVTHPLVGEKTECEIEDLFPAEVLGHTIDGKTFSRTGGSEHYGKEIFSRYISRNYKSIDFTGFIPLLNAINSAIEAYAEKEDM